MELSISPEFVKKFSIDNITFKGNVLEFDINNEYPRENINCFVKRNIINYFTCENLFFRFIFNGKIIEFEPEKQPSYYFILNGLLLESIINYQNTEFIKNIYQLQDLYNAKINRLFHLWNSIDRKTQKKIKEFFRDNIIIFTIYINEFDKIYRYKTNVQIGEKVFGFLSGNKTNIKYLNENTKVALYGVGKIGKMFSLILEKKNIEVSVYIDEYDTNESYRGIPIIKCSDLIGRNDFDLIVVTPVYDFEQIYEELRTYTDKLILSLDEIIE